MKTLKYPGTFHRLSCLNLKVVYSCTQFESIWLLKTEIYIILMKIGVRQAVPLKKAQYRGTLGQNIPNTHEKRGDQVLVPS